MGVGCSSIAALATSGQKSVVNDLILPGTAYGHTFLGTLTCAGTPRDEKNPDPRGDIGGLYTL